MTDLHTHLVPGVDDGARDPAEALLAIGALEAQGVRAVVCTPHLRSSAAAAAAVPGGYLSRCDAAWDALAAAAAGAFPGVSLHRGVELMLDTPSCDLTDPRLRLEGTRFVLVEFPFLGVPPRAADALAAIASAGWTPLLAHPERYHNAQENLADAAEWKEAGALLQLNAGSLLGRYGGRAERLAWALLREGMADVLASDHHARGVPHLSAALAALERGGADEAARMLATVNPGRILAGEAPLPVPPVGRGPLLRRWTAALRRLAG